MAINIYWPLSAVGLSNYLFVYFKFQKLQIDLKDDIINTNTKRKCVAYNEDIASNSYLKHYHNWLHIAIHNARLLNIFHFAGQYVMLWIYFETGELL